MKKRNGSMTFDCHWISMENWVETKNLVFRRSYNVPNDNLQKRSLACIDSSTLQTCYPYDGPRSGFPYYNLTTTHRERSPLSATLGHAEQLCGFEPWVPSPVPSSITQNTPTIAWFRSEYKNSFNMLQIYTIR
jgi:hypothetical protein